MLGLDALSDPALLDHLLDQVGHADLARPSDVERCLDGLADLVGVDVAVVEPVSAHHDDGVPDAGPDLLESGDGLVRSLEQVHDLVAQLADVTSDGGRRGCVRDLDRVGRGRHRQRAIRDDVAEGVEQEQEAGATRVDDAGLLERREQIGRRRQRQLGADPGGLCRLGEVVAGHQRGCTLGGAASDGEDGALHGPNDGPPSEVVGVAQRVGKEGGVHGRNGLETLGQAAEHLGEDHARVPTRTHQGAVCDGLAELGHAGGLAESLDGADHRLDRERHVRARVAIGHGVDVEAVHHLLVIPQDVPVGGEHPSDIGRLQRRGRRHGQRC